MKDIYMVIVVTVVVVTLAFIGLASFMGLA